ncbi:MAG: hypothetical protein HC851_15640 [Acaryochloris sp. RU_4_1]|nr:hypothetical protein [Acaryochloris sp. SU_5_25]NJM66991.1 hypothetical protein [Acaryochloris sp. RU_4_1]NJR55847.1 hypothetical protein [Acaryochloris sp. CRU_2_0]
MATSSSTNLKTSISLPLRLWLGAEVFFGVVAISSVFFHPEATATNFAWLIRPTVMAATFGAFYLSVGLLFVLGMMAWRWQQVRVICLPAALFSTFMLLTTFLHWEKFNVAIPPFYVWFASYLLPPPIFVALYLEHQKRSAPVGEGRTQPLAVTVRRFLGVNGLLLVSLAVIFYVFPGGLIAIAPWKFTPLAARTLSGWLTGVGALQMGMAWEGDWQRVQIATTMLMILPFALLLQFWRFPSEVQWSNLALPLLLVDFGLTAILCLGLWIIHAGRFAATREP